MSMDIQIMYKNDMYFALALAGLAFIFKGFSGFGILIHSDYFSILLMGFQTRGTAKRGLLRVSSQKIKSALKYTENDGPSL